MQKPCQNIDIVKRGRRLGVWLLDRFVYRISEDSNLKELVSKP